MEFYLNRTMCDVLEEMRVCFKTYNFAPIPGLIEEAQVMANRMEAAIGDKNDIERLEKRKKKLKREITKMESTIDANE